MAHKYMLRTRFAKDIVTEFLPPSTASVRTQKTSARSRAPRRTRVIILCDGMPGMPHAQAFAEWLSKKGFWVFSPRYRGSWESGGLFLKKSPEEDVLAVIDGLPKGFVSLWDGKKFKVKPDEIFVIGTSFGGPAAILASRDPRVKKIVAISPVIDWKALYKAGLMDEEERFVREAFGNGYRIDPHGYAKLKKGKFYSPAYCANEIDGAKLFIVHAKDDTVVRYREVAQFAAAKKKEGAVFVALKKGGHLSSRATVEKYWKRISKFFKD
jgi:dipeptidyl aminopeptidase/acylaminoacyl peptidase